MTDLETLFSWDEIYRVIEGRHYDPFRVLGLHPLEDGPQGEKRAVIHAWMPDAKQVEVVLSSGERHTMDKVLESGFYRTVLTDAGQLENYRLCITFHDGNTLENRDPYSFMPTLSDFDLELLGRGDHHHAYQKLGANLLEHGGVKGVAFAVWAPNAARVSVVGNFNGWNGLRFPMRSLGGSGVWEIFLPNLAHGEVYKFEIRTTDGRILEKSDPYGKYMELRPRTASIVWDIDDYTWSDSSWMGKRHEDHRKDPISIYEVHLGSWMRGPSGEFLSYRELAHKIADYALELNFTHVELLPVSEHPFDGSWGYQVTGYFAPTSRFGTPQDFMYFVDYLHQKGLGVLVDWVPGHFPKDISGLAYFDGQPCYEYGDPRKGEHQDWGTNIFDYGRGEVVNFLNTSALFWCEVYHIDGIRVDAVASMLYLDFSRREGEWIPNVYGGRENLEAIGFLKRMNELIHLYHPGVLTFAEESSSFPGVSAPTFAGGLGFDFKWGMGWMNDSLVYFESNPIYRPFEHSKISFYMVYAFSESYCLPISHDEVVHGKRALLDKMPGDVWQKFAGLRSFLAYMWTMPGKKLLFMGQDFGQWQEWQFEYSLDWHLLEFPSHKGAHQLVGDLNRLYTSRPALHTGDNIAGGFEWIEADDSAQSVFAYIRRDLEKPQEYVIVVCNFTPVQRDAYRIGVPEHTAYRQILSTDEAQYWGAGKGNGGTLEPQWVVSQGREQSLEVLVPALGVVILEPIRG